MSRLQTFKRHIVDQVERTLTSTGTFSTMLYTLNRDPQFSGRPQERPVHEGISAVPVHPHLLLTEPNHAIHRLLRQESQLRDAVMTAVAQLAWMFVGFDEDDNVVGHRTFGAPFDMNTGAPNAQLQQFLDAYAYVRTRRVVTISFEYVVDRTTGVTGGTMLILELAHHRFGYRITNYSEFGTEHNEVSVDDRYTRRLVGHVLYEEVHGAPKLPDIRAEQMLQIMPGPYGDENPDLDARADYAP